MAENQRRITAQCLAGFFETSGVSLGNIRQDVFHLVFSFDNMRSDGEVNYYIN
jgi:hypothetical protein